MCKIFNKIIEKLYLRQPGNLAYYDDMTGVANRQYYNRVMKIKYLRSENYVYYIDIDNIKELNDTYGHAVGSEKIKDVANELKNVHDFIEIARIGGDEFIAISKSNVDISITDTSIGVVHKEPWEDLSSCVHRADSAMYKEKEKHHMES